MANVLNGWDLNRIGRALNGRAKYATWAALKRRGLAVHWGRGEWRLTMPAREAYYAVKRCERAMGATRGGEEK